MAAVPQPLALPGLVAPEPSADWKPVLRLGHLIIVGGLGTFIAWASLARLDSAAVASGVVAAESSRKTIQHLEGGIVKEILVRDGQAVVKGQVLIRLDPTRVDTQSDLYRNQRAIYLAQEARLLAEYHQQDTLVFPKDVIALSSDPSVAPVIANQIRLFKTRRDTLIRTVQIADSQTEQARKDIEQARIDIATGKATLVQIEAELGSLQPLYKKQLVPTTRIAPLERERLRLKGVVDGGDVQIGKLKERVEEIMYRRQQVVTDYTQDASTNLIDVRRLLSDIEQQVNLAVDSQKRGEIRAPIDGTIQQMRIFTAGGVIRAGEPILDIAPHNDELIVQAHVNPNDADRVSEGMPVEVKFPSFNYWGSNMIHGTVRSISRDRITDEANKDAYFAADIVVDRSTVPKDMNQRLVAGLTAQAIISTGERSVANYLLKPLYERFYASMRER